MQSSFGVLRSVAYEDDGGDDHEIDSPAVVPHDENALPFSKVPPPISSFCSPSSSRLLFFSSIF